MVNKDNKVTDKRKKYIKQWRLENKDKVKATEKRYILKNPNSQKDGECSPLISRPRTTVSRSLKSPMNIEHTSNGTIHHQKYMQNKHADSYLSEKEKFLNDNGLEVEENGIR